MDVFYYWKDFDADLKAHRIGHFRSSKDKLDLLHEAHPDFVWAFRSPKGEKGRLQLLAKLWWSRTAPSGFRPAPGESHLYYDANHPRSVAFVGSDDPAAVDRVTEWARANVGSALLANFRGANGQHEMRGDPLIRLQRIAAGLETTPFRQWAGRAD
jgi:hypothetical protein